MKEKSEQREQERLGKAQDKENFYSTLPFNVSDIISEEGSESIYVSERWWETTRKPWLLYPGG